VVVTITFLLQSHAEIVPKFKEKYINSDNILLCFGISGAGKSTFLARLLSNNTEEDFISLLPKKEMNIKLYLI